MSKPVSERAYFNIDEIAAKLARPDGREMPDQSEREAICRDLLARADRGEIVDDAGAHGAFVITTEAPFFRRTEPALPDPSAVIRIFLPEPTATFLSRSALKRFLRQSAFAGAKRLLREWFAASSELPKGDRPQQPRPPRRNEKRPEIVQAIKHLTGSAEWEAAPDKRRCQMVERHLEKPGGWCGVRTLRRAMPDAQ